MSRFEGKAILVTGGTSGIGLATAKRVAAEGGKVAVTGSRDESIEKAKAELGDGVVAIKSDAKDADAAASLGDAVADALGELDGAFLNAGFGRFSPLEHVDPEDFAEQYNVNVRGPLLHAKALAPHMNDGGAIVLNTSIAQHMGLDAGHIYASTKGAVRTLVRTLAKEFSPRNIRVNAVSPGPIGTDFMNRTGLPQEAIDGFGAQILAAVPLGRFGTPDEVAAVSTFLLSDDASYVTGAELHGHPCQGAQRAEHFGDLGNAYLLNVL